MSKFRRSKAALQSLLPSVEALRHDEALENASEHQLERMLEQVEQVKHQLQQLHDDIEKLHMLASETDPDRKLFGDNMCKKVNALHAEFTTASAFVQECRQARFDAFEPVRVRWEEERRQKELHEQRRLEALAQEEQQKRRIEREQEAAIAGAAQQERRQREALEDAKREQQEMEERRAFERERAERRERQARENEQIQRNKERVEEAKTMPLEDVIDIVELNNSGDAFRRVIVALSDIIDNIMAAPDNPQFRHIRENNEKIQSEVLSRDGGLECLMCLGFRLRELQEPTQEMYFVMREPSPDQMDAWMNWFERLKQHQESLQRTAENFL